MASYAAPFLFSLMMSPNSLALLTHTQITWCPSVAHVTLGKYPGYTGKVKIRGEVNISVVKGSVALAWDFTGTETKCRTVHLSPANACGLHIHEGKTCGDKSTASKTDVQLVQGLVPSALCLESEAALRAKLLLTTSVI